MSDITESSNEFALALLKQLKPEGEENLIFSPSNIHMCLTMCCHGARHNTLAEMMEVLCVERFDGVAQVSSEYQKVIEKIGDHDASVELNIAHKLFVEKTFKVLDIFQKDLQIYYNSSAEMVNFFEQADSSRMLINKWVESEINKETVYPQQGTIDAGTVLVLISSTYLKGKFENQFEKSRTIDRSFFISPNKQTEVSAMQQEAYFDIYHDNHLYCGVLSLPYKGKDLDLVIILPDNKYGLEAVEEKLDSKILTKMLSSMSTHKVFLSLPKFEFRFSLSVKQALVGMGLNEAFDKARADFNGIAEIGPECDYNLYISDVLHQAVVDVDEKDSETAASTAIAVTVNNEECWLKPPLPKRFIVDHPFLFIVRHIKTGVILFVGHVVHPTPSGSDTHPNANSVLELTVCQHTSAQCVTS